MAPPRPGLEPRFRAGVGPSGALFFALVFALVFAAPAAAFGPGLQLGADVGYSATGRRSSNPPELIDGASFAAEITYVFTSSFGLRLDGSFDWHPDYTTYLVGELPGADDGPPAYGYVAGPTVSDCYLSSVGLSVVYYVDVMRLLPFVALGVAGARSDQKTDGTAEVAYEIGIRLSVGFDYLVTNRLGLGAFFILDTYLADLGDYGNRMAVLARLTFDFIRGSESLVPDGGRATITP